MKYLVTILVIVSCFIAIKAILRTTSPPPNGAITTILFDITNPNQQNKTVLSEQEIQKITTQIEADKWSKHQFKIRYIGDVLYTESLVKNLASAKPTTSNIYLRNKLIKDYISDIEQDIQEAQNLPFDKNHSLVFETITHELQLLRQSPAARKTLIITSDLMENSAWLSLYEAENYYLLIHETEQIFELYKERFTPINLNGIEVYFTYQANDYNEGKTYEKLIYIYKKLLEENGAKVHIGRL